MTDYNFTLAVPKMHGFTCWINLGEFVISQELDGEVHKIYLSRLEVQELCRNLPSVFAAMECK